MGDQVLKCAMTVLVRIFQRTANFRGAQTFPGHRRLRRRDLPIRPHGWTGSDRGILCLVTSPTEQSPGTLSLTPRLEVHAFRCTLLAPDRSLTSAAAIYP